MMCSNYQLDLSTNKTPRPTPMSPYYLKIQTCRCHPQASLYISNWFTVEREALKGEIDDRATAVEAGSAMQKEGLIDNASREGIHQDHLHLMHEADVYA